VARLETLDLTTFAAQKLPVLTGFAAKTENLRDAADYHRYYRDTTAAMERLLERG